MTARVAAGDFWHVGIIVENLDNAREGLAVEMGIALGPTMTFPFPQLIDRVGHRSVDLNVAFTTGEPPYLELIEAVDDGGIYSLSSATGLHHLGYWADMHEQPSPYTLENLGAEALVLEEDGALRAAYLGGGTGGAVRFEIISRAMRDDIFGVLRS